MLNANELRIGNFIMDSKNSVDNVESITTVEAFESANGINIRTEEYSYQSVFATPFSEINGIPINVEWLGRLGFQYERVNTKYMGQSGEAYFIHIGPAIVRDIFLVPYSKSKWSAYITETRGYESAQLLSVYQYVHQLQNLYFALTGEELGYQP